MGKKKNGGNGKKAAPRAEAAGPAYFLSLKLQKVRCFGPEQTLDLSDGKGRPAQWTILLGNNGTGKTTVLQALVAFQPIRDSIPVQAFSWPSNGLSSILRKDCAEAACMGVTVGYGGPLAALGSRSQAREVWLVLEKHETGIAMSHSPGDVVAPLCYAYGASRRLSASFVSGEEADATASLFSDDAPLRNAEEWLLRLDYSASKPSPIQARQQERREQVKRLLIEILPPEEVTDLRFTTPTELQPTPRVEFRTPYGWVVLRQLGHGYRTLIAWMVDFASRMVERHSESPDPLAEPAVVLVDEIDLHLHPTWQRKLMEFLTERFPNTQFIATAHSPLVAQAAADANLVALRREGDHVVIDNDVENIRGWRIDQILTSGLFGLESARPPQIERLLSERKELLTKPKLTAAERRRLEEIEAEVGQLPTGHTAQEVREREEIRKTLDLLMKDRRPPS
jgi:AAA domain, putative AbiEii toxin, Type IV TA system